jgi:hypothetical protein
MAERLYKRIPDTGATQEDNDVRYLLDVLELLEPVVELVATTSANVIHNT